MKQRVFSLLLINWCFIQLFVKCDAAATKQYKTHRFTPYEAAALGGIPTCCPESPFLHCDFYFDGFEHSIPVFELSDGVEGDHPLNTVFSSKLNWKGWTAQFSPSVKDIKSGNKAYIGSTWKNGTFLQCDSLPSYVNTEGQFFISNILNVDGSKLFARRFQRSTPTQHGVEFYQDRCILLPLTQIGIPTASGNLNLDINDKNPNYPEERRCLIFKTGK